MTMRRRPRLWTTLFVFCTVQGWTQQQCLWGFRGGSTDYEADEAILIEAFQEEVVKMRQEIQAEAQELVESLRQEILEAKERKKGSKRLSDAILAQDEYDDAEEEEMSDQNLDAVDYESDQESEVAPRVTIRKKKVRFSTTEDDDFVVGDSDEDTDSVLKRLKTEQAIPEEEEEPLDEPLEFDADAFTTTPEEDDVLTHLSDAEQEEPFSPKPLKKKQKKKKRKRPKQKVPPPLSSNEQLPETTVKKKKKKKKRSISDGKKKKKKTKASTSLSEQSKASQAQQVKLSGPLIEIVIKGVMMVVLVALTLMISKIVEKSVTGMVK